MTRTAPRPPSLTAHAALVGGTAGGLPAAAAIICTLGYRDEAYALLYGGGLGGLVYLVGRALAAAVDAHQRRTAARSTS